MTCEMPKSPTTIQNSTMKKPATGSAFLICAGSPGSVSRRHVEKRLRARMATRSKRPTAPFAPKLRPASVVPSRPATLHPIRLAHPVAITSYSRQPGITAQAPCTPDARSARAPGPSHVRTPRARPMAEGRGPKHQSCPNPMHARCAQREGPRPLKDTTSKRALKGENAGSPRFPPSLVLAVQQS